MIDGGAGNDSLFGQQGGDEFLFGPDSGRDTIFDFDPGQDSITLQGLNFNDVGEVLAASSERFGNTFIDLGDGNQIRLVGVDKDDLDGTNISVAPLV